MKPSRIWITWEHQPRNRSMSKCVNAKYFEVVIESNRLVRYFISIIRTLRIIHSENPSIIFVQNPSMVLSTLAVLCRPLWRYNLVIDQHNSGLFPLEGKSKVLNHLAKLILRNADVNIVTNEALAQYVTRENGNGLVVPDPLPDINIMHDPEKRKTSKDLFNILFICSWSKDEPYMEVIEGVRTLSNKPIKIYASGNYSKSLSKDQINNLPDNFILTGFLSYEEYCNLLRDVDAVLVLTKRDNCLNCGIYEALSLGKPGVISNRKALGSYFNKGYVLTDLTPSAIFKSVNFLIERYSLLCSEAEDLRSELSRDHRYFLINLENKIDALK